MNVPAKKTKCEILSFIFDFIEKREPLGEIIISMVLGSGAFVVTQLNEDSWYLSIILGIIISIVTFIILYTVKIYKKSQEMFKNLNDISENFKNTENILFPAYGRDDKSKNVMGVIPETSIDFADKNDAGKWKTSISILNAFCCQNLLLSPQYLEYFFALSSDATSNIRIVIINNNIRHYLALEAFLQLSKINGIQTYLYYKSEIYDVIGEIRSRTGEDINALEIINCLEGQVELRFDTDLNSICICKEKKYTVRYVYKNTPEQENYSSNDKKFDKIELLIKILNVFIDKRDRSLDIFFRNNPKYNIVEKKNIKKILGNKVNLSKDIETLLNEYRDVAK